MEYLPVGLETGFKEFQETGSAHVPTNIVKEFTALSPYSSLNL